MTQIETPVLLTAKEATALVRLSDKTMLRATERGEPTGRFRVIGRNGRPGVVRYRRAELLAWAGVTTPLGKSVAHEQAA